MNNIYCQKCGAPSAAASKPSFCHRCGANMLGGAKSQAAARELPKFAPRRKPQPHEYDVDVGAESDFNDGDYGDVEADIDYNMAMRASKLDFEFERIDNNNPIRIENVVGTARNEGGASPKDENVAAPSSYSMEDFAREAGSLKSKS